MNSINPRFEMAIPSVQHFLTGSREAILILAHQKSDPYTIELNVDGHTWFFDRIMLNQGLLTGVGVGNVRLFPLLTDSNVIGFALKENDKGVALTTSKVYILNFLNRIEMFSPSEPDLENNITNELEKFFK